MPKLYALTKVVKAASPAFASRPRCGDGEEEMLVELGLISLDWQQKEDILPKKRVF